MKRELCDYLITLFGYLSQEEVRELVLKISKEHNFRIQAAVGRGLKNRLLDRLKVEAAAAPIPSNQIIHEEEETKSNQA